MSAAYLNRENAKRSCPGNRKSTGCQSAIPLGSLRGLEAAGKGQDREQKAERWEGVAGFNRQGEADVFILLLD